MKAIIIGATGAVGKDLVELLIKNDQFTEVLVFVRRDFPVKHPKITQHIINFDKPEEWKHWVQGDVLFSAMGTTLKQAGSKGNQWKIDYSYQYEFAKIAHENGIEQLILVSSANANEKSPFFYMKMKGALEEALKKLAFGRLVIFRPPLLIRKNSDRSGENISAKILQFFNTFGLFKKMKPMPTEFLAQRMMEASLQTEKGIFTKEPEQIWKG